MKEISKEVFNEINKNGKSTNGEGEARDFIMSNSFPEGSKTFDDCERFEDEKDIKHQQFDAVKVLYDGKERIVACRTNYDGWTKTNEKYYELDNWEEAKRISNIFDENM